MRGRHRQIWAMGAVLLSAVLAACGVQTSPSPGATGSSVTPSTTPSTDTPVPSGTEGPSEPGWHETGSLSADPTRELHAHALGDGRVLVIRDDTTAELWDRVSGEWHVTAGLNNPRTRFASVALPDGRVLVAGGLDDKEQSYSSAYLFDPASESWQKADGLMITARTTPSMALLPDGRVLLVGGYFHKAPEYVSVNDDIVLAAFRTSSRGNGGFADVVPGPFGSALATAEIFDPATGQWSSTGSMRFARNGPAITPLADGRILVVGSLDWANTGVEVARGAMSSAEIYDPATGKFSPAGEFPALDLSGPQADGFDLGELAVTNVGLLLPLRDGGAVLIDHSGYWKHQGNATRSLRFDSGSGTWREIGQTYVYASDFISGTTYQTPVTPRFNPAAAVLADGRVVVAGGYSDALGRPISLASAQLYDPDLDIWQALPEMPEGRTGPASATLDDGSVLLVCGGLHGADGTYLPLRSAVILTLDP